MKICLSRQLILLVMILAMLLVSACRSGNKKPGYYNEAETPSLDVPSGLDYPDTSQALIIQTPYMQPPAMVMTDIPPRISSTTSGLNKNSRLSWSSQGLYLLVEDTPESVHRRLGLVIDRSGMQRVRLDEKGVYRFDYYQVFEDDRGFFKKMAFWSRDKSEQRRLPDLHASGWRKHPRVHQVRRWQRLRARCGRARADRFGRKDGLITSRGIPACPLYHPTRRHPVAGLSSR